MRLSYLHSRCVDFFLKLKLNISSLSFLSVKRLIVFSLFVSFWFIGGEAQVAKLPAFGKVSMDELKATECLIDSEAQAYYIFDKGQTDFVYYSTTIRTDEAGSGKGFQMKYERHLRVKILDQAAVSALADFELPLYTKGQDKEQIVFIKGFTYNLVDGKIVKTKLDSKQIITDRKDDNWIVVKFAMPDVREGSVFEVSYQILSDFFFNLQEWQFQRLYPVMYSEYKVALPQYFFYNVNNQGYLSIDHAKSSASKSIVLTVIEKDPRTGDTERYSFKEDYREHITKYYTRDVPAFKVESFLRTPRNYLSKITFELTGVQFPRSPYKNYSNSWGDVSKELMKYESFGRVLTRNTFLKDEVEAIKSLDLTAEEQIVAVFERVKEKVKWNGVNSLFASDPNLRQSWNKGTGNSADINLTLVSFLTAMGIESYPVALSTRANGMIPLSHPSISGFNYVIAMAMVGDKEILMDATDPFAGVEMLPERCLNDRGRVIDEHKSKWVTLDANGLSNQVISGNLTVDSKGGFNGNIEISENGYVAWSSRSAIKKHSNEEAYKEEVEKAYRGVKISDITISGADSVYDALKCMYQVSIEDRTEQIADMLIFNPLLFFAHSDNPFKLENRDYPVEYPYMSRRRVLLTYTIPEGYEVESIPTPQRMLAEDRSFTFLYNITQLGNTIHVVHDFSINKTMFLPNEYDALKSFYARVIDKHGEKIVLKKLSN